MNKYSKQILNKRNKNTAKQTTRISTTFDICFTISVNKAISPISNQILSLKHAFICLDPQVCFNLLRELSLQVFEKIRSSFLRVQFLSTCKDKTAIKQIFTHRRGRLYFYAAKV